MMIGFLSNLKTRFDAVVGTTPKKGTLNQREPKKKK